MKPNRLFSIIVRILLVLVIVSVLVSAVLFILDRPSGTAPSETTAVTLAPAPVETFTPSDSMPTHQETAAATQAQETTAAPTEQITEPAPTAVETEPAPTAAETEPAPTAAETEPAHTEQETTPPTQAPATHSELYIEGVDVEDVILYFNEVCLDSEFVSDGDPTRIQKWLAPIRYTVQGDYTEEDIAVLESFVNWLNDMPGFPGISETQESYRRNLLISFCGEQDMVDLMGENFWGLDGGVTFWYSEDHIYNCVISCRSDISQYTRNSVILEEIYNGLGPVQDTSLREDSLIFQGFSEPQWLTPVDELILKLLYHPDILPGMNAQECEQVIRNLYY